MDQPLLNYMRPGIVLCVAYPAAAADGDALVRGIEAIASDVFFSSVEVRDVPDGDARRRMVEILRVSGLDVVYETYPRLRRLGLSLSSTDAARRDTSVREGKRAIDEAIEIGAVRVNVASGPDPGPAGHDDAGDALVDSLYTLAAYAAAQDGPTLALEPLPRACQDASLIGSTAEAVETAHEVLEQPLLGPIVGSRSAIVPFPIKGGKLYLYNNNPLIAAGYPGTDGVKTGYTNAAGRCLVVTVRRGRRWLGLVLLHSADPASQAQNLLSAAFSRLGS